MNLSNKTESERPLRESTVAPKDSTRNRILHVALAVFSDQGYDGTSTREICKRAGVNGAALNYHWGSKEQLWKAVCAECGRRMLAVLEDHTDASAPSREGFLRFLDAFWDALATEPGLARIPTWAALQSGAMDFDAAASTIQPVFEMSRTYLEKLQSNRDLDQEVDAAMTAQMVLGELLYFFADPAGQRTLFGKDAHDPEHSARAKRAFLRTARLGLGLGVPLEESGRRRVTA